MGFKTLTLNKLIVDELIVKKSFNRGAVEALFAQSANFLPTGRYNPLALYNLVNYYQTPGYVWVSRANSHIGNDLLSIANNGTIFVTVGAGGRISRSTDNGTTWSALVGNNWNAADPISGIIYGGGKFVTWSTLSPGRAKKISYSTDDGATWSALSADITLNAVGNMAYSNGYFFILDSGGNNIYRSPDAITWTLIGHAGLSINGAIIVASSIVLAAGGTSVARSTDFGVTWTSVIVSGTNVTCLSFGNGKLIEADGAGSIQSSPDLGLTWNTVTSPFGGVNAVTYGNGIWIASGVGVVAVSLDNGVSFVLQTIHPFGTNTIGGLASNGNRTIGVSTNGVIATTDWLPCTSVWPEIAYTPTFTGFGTVSGVNFTFTRVGNRLKGMGTFTSGTNTATEARISLPYSIISDAILVPSIEVCGICVAAENSTTYFGSYCLIESGKGYITLGRQTSTADGTTKKNGNNFGSNELMLVQFEFAASGWN